MKNGPYELIKAPSDWPGKRYRNRYCYEHHYVYWKNTGHILNENELIHHINGDKRDNTFENLELSTLKEHGALHGSEKLVNLVELKCPVCGLVFIRSKRHTHLVNKKRNLTCCSRKCSASLSTIYKYNRMDIIEEYKKMNVISEFKGKLNDYIE